MHVWNGYRSRPEMIARRSKHLIDQMQRIGREGDEGRSTERASRTILIGSGSLSHTSWATSYCMRVKPCI
jgi:hypothetical protein